MESRIRAKERQEQQRILQEQIERMKIKCSKCGQTIIPKKVGEIFLCPNCSFQFKSQEQITKEWKKGLDVANVAKYVDSQPLSKTKEDAVKFRGILDTLIDIIEKLEI